MWKVGHSLIKAKMKERTRCSPARCPATSSSPHRYFGFDDAIYSGARLVELSDAATSRRWPSTSTRCRSCYNTPEIRSSCPDEIKFEVVQRARRPRSASDYDVVDVDGARVTFEGGWGLVRASNTGPALVLRFEADSAERLGEIQTLVEGPPGRHHVRRRRSPSRAGRALTRPRLKGPHPWRRGCPGNTWANAVTSPADPRGAARGGRGPRLLFTQDLSADGLPTDHHPGVPRANLRRVHDSPSRS